MKPCIKYAWQFSVGGLTLPSTCWEASESSFSLISELLIMQMSSLGEVARERSKLLRFYRQFVHLVLFTKKPTEAWRDRTALVKAAGSPNNELENSRFTHHSTDRTRTIKVFGAGNEVDNWRDPMPVAPTVWMGSTCCYASSMSRWQSCDCYQYLLGFTSNQTSELVSLRKYVWHLILVKVCRMHTERLVNPLAWYLFCWPKTRAYPMRFQMAFWNACRDISSLMRNFAVEFK